jgi:hypothetical protein
MNKRQNKKQIGMEKIKIKSILITLNMRWMGHSWTWLGDVLDQVGERVRWCGREGSAAEQASFSQSVLGEQDHFRNNLLVFFFNLNTSNKQVRTW